MSQAKTTSTPRHLWVVGSAALLWPLLAAIDYTLLTTRNAWYESGFTEEQLQHGSAFSSWAFVNYGSFIGGGNDVTLLVPAGFMLAWGTYALSMARKGVLV